MHIEKSHQDRSQAVKLILREAKKLHRAAVSGALATSLPILRRLLAAQVLRGLSLPELSRNRSLVQRKHVLRTLAIEAGYSSWEEYRRVLGGMSPELLPHYDIVRHTAGYPNLWFPSAAEAEVYAAAHGGRAIRVGHQGVVFPDIQPDKLTG